MLETAGSVVSLVSGVITAVAVLTGGGWAYFKFVKGRTYRPRIKVDLAAQWRAAGDGHRLHARITVHNTGASVIVLKQYGTGLRVSVLAAEQPQAPAAQEWRELRVFEVFGEHGWVEQGETVSDELFLDLGVPTPEMTLFEARLVWRYGRGREVVVFARRVIPADATMTP